MPDGDRVGSAYVDIHVNAAPGEAELAAFKAKVDRDFDELGRKKAEASLNLKKLDFDKEIDDAKAQLDYFKKRRADATLGLAKAHFDEEIAAAEAELKALTSKKRTIQLDSRQVKAANDAERLLSKERALTERQAIQSAKAERSLSNEREKAVTRTFKERAELAKLGQEYEKLRGRQIGLEKSSRGVFSSRSIATADKEARRLEQVASKADYVKHRIESLGGTVDDLDPQIQKNHTLWGRWLSRLGDTSIRLGPVTTSVKGLATGLGLLGPLVFELGGGVTALAGTVGEGLAGAFTVGAGAVAGFAASAAGVGFVIGPMIGEFKEVHSATLALAKAQLKYGKDSTQAKTATEQLNHELHGVSPIAKEGIQAWGNLSSRWKDLTKAARPAVFNAFGESLKTVQSLLPAFASESTKTTQVASKAWDGWMKSLRSSEAKGLLQNVMSDFRASIPGLASGLGSLVAMMGRLAAAGAHFLPGLSNGFADWANNLEQAVGGGQKLQHDVGGMVSQMRDLGHLTQDTGSLLVHIFSAGADSGQGMVKSLDQVIKRWDKWTQSASGKNGLQEFFSDSKGATEDFMSSLSHMTKLLFEFSRATAPVANGLLKIVTWIGDLVSAADGIVGVKTIFQGLGLVLAGLFVTSKVMAFADALTGVAARFGIVEAATTGDIAATEALTAATVELTAALTAEADAAIAADAGLGAGAAGATRAALGLDGATESAGLLSAALAPEVLIPAAAIAGMAVLAANTGHVGTAFQKAAKEFSSSNNEIDHSLKHIEGTTSSYIDSQHAAADATDSVKAAQNRVRKLFNEDAPMKKQTAAQVALTDAEKQAGQVGVQVAHQNAKQTSNAKELLKVSKERVKAAEDEIKNSKELAGVHKGMGAGGPVADRRDAERAEQAAKGERDLAKARGEVTRASNELALATVPLTRETKGLDAISQQTMNGLKELSKTIGAGAAAKIGNFVKPGDVAKVTELSNKLNTLGRGSQVKSIDVKSHGADETIGKLKQLQHQTSKVEGHTAKLTVKSNDTQANASLRKIAALSQRVTGGRNTIKILANSSNAEQAIQRLHANLVQVAHNQYQAKITAIDKATPVGSMTNSKLHAYAATKYQAKITAIDNASSVAKKAEGSAKSAGRQKPHINITASASQALGQISAVEAALSGLHDKTVNVNVVTHKSGGFAGGYSAAYYSAFAQGGLNDRELQRANERAVLRQSGASRKVSRPTMLVGEQAPNHPEYVIATNPAYRASNERYLEDAASDLGYEAIPAYKEGKGKKKKSSSGPSGGGGPKGHPNKQHNGHFYLKHNKFSSQATEEYNTEERDISLKENLYNKEVEREEKEIQHGSLSEWNWPLLKGYLTDERNDYRKLGTLTKTIRGDTNAAIKNAKKKAKSLTGPINTERHLVSQLSGEYSAVTAPSKGSMSDKEYEEAKKHAKARKRHLDKQKKQAEASLKKMEKEKENALSIEREAKEKLNEIGRQSGSIFEKENVIKEEEAQTNLTYFEGELKERTAPNEGAAADLPSYGEQTATLNTEREREFNEFGSNVSGFYGAGAGTRTPLGTNSTEYAPGGQASSAAASQAAATTGPGGYMKAAARGFGGGGLPTNVLSQGAATDGSSGTVNNVTNNFAAPPPDPHTWAKQQKFELGAIA